MRLKFYLPSTHRYKLGGNVFNELILRHLARRFEVETVVVDPETVPGDSRNSPVEGGGEFCFELWDSTLVQSPHVLSYLQPQESCRRFLLVHYLHLLEEKETESVRVAREKTLLPLFDGFVATSYYAQQRLVECGVEAEKIAVIRPGISDPYRQPVSRPEENNPVNLLTVSALLPDKGEIEFLAILQNLPPLPWHWHLIGEVELDSAYYQRFLRKLHTLSLGERVTVHGPKGREEIFQFYQQCDLLVLPSHFETCSMVAMEAMARGLPVLAYRVGGIPEIVVDGETGYLIPPGDQEMFTLHLAVLIENRELRRSFGQAAKLESLKFPTWEETADRLHQFLFQSLSEA